MDDSILPCVALLDSCLGPNDFLVTFLWSLQQYFCFMASDFVHLLMQRSFLLLMTCKSYIALLNLVKHES